MLTGARTLVGDGHNFQKGVTEQIRLLVVMILDWLWLGTRVQFWMDRLCCMQELSVGLCTMIMTR